MDNYTIYDGHFPCKTCKSHATVLRFWKNTKDLTWQCANKHMSKVSLATEWEKRKSERA